MRRRLLLPLLAGLLAAAPAALAQDEYIIVRGISLRPNTCPHSRTVAVSLEEVTTKPEAFDGKCVRLRGQAVGGDQLASLAGPSGQGEPAAIGVYGGARVLGQFRRAQLLSVDVVGLIGACKRGIDYTGYCHYHQPGTFVILASVRPLGPVEKRPDRSAP